MTPSEKLQRFYWEKSHRIADNIVERQCSKCKKWLPENLSNFYMRNKSKSEMGYAPECKECIILRSQKYNANNAQKRRDTSKKQYITNKDYFKEKNRRNKKLKPEFYRNIEKSWQNRNKDKIKKYYTKHRNHDISQQEWQDCQKAFNYQCAYCGKTLDEQYEQNHEQFHKDHVDDDGYNDLRNCVPACTQCNTRKHKSSILDWYTQQEFYSLSRLNKINWWMEQGYKDYIEYKLPYKIIRKKNEDNRTYHYELWSIDDKRNPIECIHLSKTKKELETFIKQFEIENIKC